MRWEIVAVMLGREGVGDRPAVRWVDLRSMSCPVESPCPDHLRSLRLDPPPATEGAASAFLGLRAFSGLGAHVACAPDRPELLGSSPQPVTLRSWRINAPAP